METPGARLTSLDALRGLDMLIIMGIDALVYALYPVSGGGEAWKFIREQMGHAPWEGLRLYDCVFPLFVFMSGMAMCFSHLRRIDAPLGKTLRHLWGRALALVLLGFLVNGNISWDLSTMRCASVLGLIGLSGALAGTFTLLCGGRMLPNLALAGLILCGVGVAQQLGGDYTPGGCFNARVDALLYPGVLHSGSYDPEGPFCIISATALSLLGYCAGRLFLNIERGPLRVSTMLVCGLILLAGGWCLPCIKGIWTPGFVLCCAGISAILMARFHLVIDVLGLVRWCLPLRVVGLNALAIYILTHLISFPMLTNRMLGGTWALFLTPEWQRVANAAAALLL
ncbi:MAG: hypothetical protein IJY72_03850, partial [Akkermansia sp.]|nr:hypothetical protein [Akkermansia sp.]